MFAPQNILQFFRNTAQRFSTLFEGSNIHGFSGEGRDKDTRFF